MRIIKITSREESGFKAEEEGTTRYLQVSRTNPDEFKISIAEKTVRFTGKDLMELTEAIKDLVVRNSKSSDQT